MTLYTDLADKAGDRVVSALKTAEDVAVNAAKPVGTVTGEFAPRVRAAVPFAERLPTAVEVVEANFSLARRVLDAQRSLALGVVKALAPESKAKAKPAVKAEK